MKLKMFIAAFLCTGFAFGQTFQDFINRVNAAPEAQRAALVDSFINAVPSFPFVEQSTTVHFIYRGSAGSVTVPGDANG